MSTALLFVQILRPVLREPEKGCLTTKAFSEDGQVIFVNLHKVF